MSTLSTLKFRVSLFAAVLAFVSPSPAIHAQDVGMLGRVDVPFAFETGSGHHFDAGVYFVRMENQHILLIKGQSNSGLAMTSVEDNARPATASKAVFRKYGNRYFLGEISIAGKSRKLRLQPSKAESRLQIGNAPQATGIEVALMNGAR